MPFTFVVRFTGICAFVPDKAFSQAPTKVCVVLPYAFFEDQSTPPDAADSTKLRRHMAMVKFFLRNVPNVNPSVPDATAVWYLDRQRLTFDTGGVPAPPPNIINLDYLIDVTRVAPNFAAVDSRHLEWGITGRGVSQVMFDRGDLEHAQPTDPSPWVFPSTLSGTIVQMSRITSGVSLTLHNLTTLELLVRPLGGGNPTRLRLAAPDGGVVAIEIANFCDDNPLRWPTQQVARVPDQDFKWYFELLHPVDRTNLATVALRGLPLPVPHPVGAGNAQGANCPPAVMSPYNFVLD